MEKNIVRKMMLAVALALPGIFGAGNVQAQSQCGIENTAFQGGEFLAYDLYFNWKFVWLKVGNASMSTVKSKFDGKEAYRTSLITRGNERLDGVFVMRDTLL